MQFSALIISLVDILLRFAGLKGHLFPLLLLLLLLGDDIFKVAKDTIMLRDDNFNISYIFKIIKIYLKTNVSVDTCVCVCVSVCTDTSIRSDLHFFNLLIQT